MSDLEEIFFQQLKTNALPTPVCEYKFHPTRKFRFDFAWPEYMLACEIEGGTWSKGRHTTGIGFEKDCLKYDEAMRLGWTVYRCTGDMVMTGRAIETVEMLIHGYGLE